MPQDVPSLTDGDRRRIVMTLGRWSAVHPRRHLPIVALADGSELTPLDMARAVAEPENPIGQYLFRVFACGLIPDNVEEPETLDHILADYENDAARWAGGQE